MNDRTGQTWQEDRKIFVVIGAPAEDGGWWARHPVCYLDEDGTPSGDPGHVDEGGITWEEQPYMQRLG